MGTLVRGVTRVVAVAAVLWTSACTSGGPPQQWVEPPDYTYESSIVVFGPAQGEWRITVRDHEVAKVEGLDKWSVIGPYTSVEDFGTLADYIARYDEARERGAHSVALEQAGDGTPTSYSVDWAEDTADDEYAATFRDVAVAGG